MTDRERQLEAEIAWLRYGTEQMNLALRERNAVWINRAEVELIKSKSESGDEEEDKPEFEHVIVCGCKQCMASHRFGQAEADNIFSSFDDDERRECIIKKCLRYQCKKVGLVCITQKGGDYPRRECHIALVEDSDGEKWSVIYGGLLLDPPLFHEGPGYAGLVSVFDTLVCGVGRALLDISQTTDSVGFFTDGSGVDYVEVARRRGFMHEGDETGAEYKARRAKEEDSGDEDSI